MKLLASLLRDRRGATAIEYGLILSLAVLAMLVGLQFMADATTGMWDDVATQVVEAS